MAEFKSYSVTVVIQEGCELDRRLMAVARAEGISTKEAVERAAERAAGNGIYHHIRSNLEIMERGIRKREKEITNDPT